MKCERSELLQTPARRSDSQAGRVWDAERRNTSACTALTLFDAAQYSPTLAERRHARNPVTIMFMAIAALPTDGSAPAATPANVAHTSASAVSGRARSEIHKNGVRVPKLRPTARYSAAPTGACTRRERSEPLGSRPMPC